MTKITFVETYPELALQASWAIRKRNWPKKFEGKTYYALGGRYHSRKWSDEVAGLLRKWGYYARVFFDTRTVDTYRIFVRRK
jgi:hypothetical protein